jgi:hypothetical protein
MADPDPRFYTSDELMGGGQTFSLDDLTDRGSPAQSAAQRYYYSTTLPTSSPSRGPIRSTN